MGRGRRKKRRKGEVKEEGEEKASYSGILETCVAKHHLSRMFWNLCMELISTVLNFTLVLWLCIYLISMHCATCSRDCTVLPVVRDCTVLPVCAL